MTPRAAHALGYRQRPAPQFAKSADELRARNDDLFGFAPFRDFLADVARAANYLGRTWSGGVDPMRDRQDGLRDLVTSVVVNSTKGPEWLRDLAKTRADSLLRQELQKEQEEQQERQE